MEKGGTDSMFESTGVEIVSNEYMLCRRKARSLIFFLEKPGHICRDFAPSRQKPATSLALVMLLLSEVRSSVEKLVYIY